MEMLQCNVRICKLLLERIYIREMRQMYEIHQRGPEWSWSGANTLPGLHSGQVEQPGGALCGLAGVFPPILTCKVIIPRGTNGLIQAQWPIRKALEPLEGPASYWVQSRVPLLWGTNSLQIFNSASLFHGSALLFPGHSLVLATGAVFWAVTEVWSMDFSGQHFLRGHWRGRFLWLPLTCNS